MPVLCLILIFYIKEGLKCEIWTGQSFSLNILPEVINIIKFTKTQSVLYSMVNNMIPRPWLPGLIKWLIIILSPESDCLGYKSGLFHLEIGNLEQVSMFSTSTSSS